MSTLENISDSITEISDHADLFYKVLYEIRNELKIMNGHLNLIEKHMRTEKDDPAPTDLEGSNWLAT